MIWPIDPKTKEPSVSLAILVVSTLLMVVAVGLSLAGISKATDLVLEFWLGSAGLYWGRKFTSKKGAIMDALESVQKQIEDKTDKSDKGDTK